MTHRFSETNVGQQRISTTSTTQNHPLGTIVRATDLTTNQEGEYIYLLGVASTVVGSIVTYSGAFATALCPVGGNKSLPVAVAMSANGAAAYGWYQIGGIATAAKSCATSLAAGAAVGVLTAGFAAATGTSKELQGAIVSAVASAAAGRTTVKILIDRPTTQGRIT
jgi:hypothetical protein